jgi:hypothetical protein
MLFVRKLRNLQTFVCLANIVLPKTIYFLTIYTPLRSVAGITVVSSLCNISSLVIRSLE